MTSDHLYIIGNGFDCYHGAKCSYAEFRKYLLDIGLMCWQLLTSISDLGR